MAGNYKNPNYMKEWRSNNKEQRNNYLREWRKKNPRNSRGHNLKHIYGLSLEDFAALSKSQDHKCAICGLETKLFVDHNHTTKKIRGLLCHLCNVGIGCLKDDVQMLERALFYLRKECGNG